MLADDRDVVIAVDTHKHTHTAAAVSATGSVLEQLTVPADPKGYRQLIAFGHRHAPRWAIEGTGSFGAGLTAALLAQGVRVVEVDRPQRPARRAGAKSDEIDAVRAARTGKPVEEDRLSQGGGIPGHRMVFWAPPLVRDRAGNRFVRLPGGQGSPRRS